MTEEDKAERMALAILGSLDGWIADVDEIAKNSIPITGNLGRALHLMRRLQQARGTLRDIAGLPED
jgi:hypothetical protein